MAAEKTAYHVLKQTRAPLNISDTASASPGPTTPAYDLVAASIDANNAEHAIRVHAEKSQDSGTFIAVPSRSWKPVPVTIETQTVIKLGEAA